MSPPDQTLDREDGNRTAQTVTKGTAAARTLSVDETTNRVNGWIYDAAGNTLNDGVNQYAYDAENRITQLAGGTALYYYDGHGNRVMKYTAGETIYYVNGGEYSSVSGWKKLYVFQGRDKLAEYSGGTTWFYFADHLGSPRVKRLKGGFACLAPRTQASLSLVCSSSPCLWDRIPGLTTITFFQPTRTSFDLHEFMEISRLVSVWRREE